MPICALMNIKYIATNYDNAIIKSGAGEAPPYPAP